MKEKVFIIGLQRTCTSSVKRWLENNGYKICDYDATSVVRVSKKQSPRFFLLKRYDGAKDQPWATLYKDIYKLYPDAKYILTIRDSTDRWFKSKSYHQLRASGETAFARAATNKVVYGKSMAVYNEELYKEKYERHNSDVIDFFRDKQDQFIIMCPECGDNEKKLERFLGIDSDFKLDVPKKQDYTIYEELKKEALSNPNKYNKILRMFHDK